MRLISTTLGLLAVGLLSVPAIAADKTVAEKNPSLSATHHFRASTIEDMPVTNAAGEELGKLNDLVIDLESGKIVYGALDFGGFLGIGDKLFAVPWSALKYETKGGHRHLVFNATKDQLKNAPGFDKNHWPDFASPTWSQDVDRYYKNMTSARR